jgi:class 3 adenylate cyclase
MILGGDEGVLGGVALVLGLAAVARYAQAVVSATRDAPARLFAAFERESEAKGRFLPRTLVDRLGRSSLADVMVGDRATERMTVLFADIRDSTALTEELSSEDAFVLIADFFARSARVVREHRGSVDRYLGDGYMALFPRCVEDALDAAIALQAAVRDLNREGIGPPIQIGVGLHTGPVTFGTVGDARHIDTTVVSDTVNTAKRVEGLSKRLRAQVVATEDVMHLVRDTSRYIVRPLGAQAVRGKRDPIDVMAIEPMPDVRRVNTVQSPYAAKRRG